MWLGIFLKIIIPFGQIQIYKSAHWNQNLTSLFHCFENCLHLFVHRYCKFTRTFGILQPVFGFVENILFRRSVGWSFCIFHQLSGQCLGFMISLLANSTYCKYIFRCDSGWVGVKSSKLFTENTYDVYMAYLTILWAY